MTTEYRAVFGHPNGDISHGDVRPSLDAALADRPQRAEETLAVLVGVQLRPVEPWRWVGLNSILTEDNRP